MTKPKNDTTTEVKPAEVYGLLSIIDRADQIYHNRPGTSTGLVDKQYDEIKTRLRGMRAVLDADAMILEGAEAAPMRVLIQAIDDRLHRVGAPVSADSALAKVDHEIAMGSLENSMSEEEFIAWMETLPEGVQVLGMPKFDGLSVAIHYVDGELARAITRGDGFIGEDITHNAVYFRGVPMVLTRPWTGWVRGEIVLPVEAWAAADPDMGTNPRNLAAGIARRKDSTQAELLSLLPFWSNLGEPHSLSQALSVLPDLGFCEAGYKRVLTGDPEVLKAYHADAMTTRAELPYWIDGTVFVVDSFAEFDRMGVTNKRPKAATAWKPVEEEVQTKLTGVTVTVGHTGKIIPTAVLEPVRIAGTTITAAHLSNWDEIARLHVNIGDTVTVIKAGEIIPKVIASAQEVIDPEIDMHVGDYITVHTIEEGYSDFEMAFWGRVAAVEDGSVTMDKRFRDGADATFGMEYAKYARDRGTARMWRIIPMPTECPVCQGEVMANANTDGSQTADIYCQNPVCPAKSKGKIDRWIRSLNILGLGDEILDGLTAPRLLGEPYVKSIADLYRLNTKAIELAKLPLGNGQLGSSRLHKILAEIDRTRELTIDEFLGSLGIKYLGKRRVALIRQACDANAQKGSLDCVESWMALADRSYLTDFAEELGIPGVAGEIQESINEMGPLIRELLTVINIKETPKMAKSTNAKAATSSKVAGKTFCFTGVRMKPEEAQALADAGGVEKGGVSAKLDYLVAKDPESHSGKAETARANGFTQVIGLEAFREMLQG